MKHFLIDKNYGVYFSGMGFSMDEVLKKAMLPEDPVCPTDAKPDCGGIFPLYGGDRR